METQPQVVKLSSGTLSSFTTSLTLTRVKQAVLIDEKGKLLFLFNEAENQLLNFYMIFLTNVAAYPENPARSKAQYLKNQIAANPTAYTVAEIAFLCKVLVEPDFTLPITLTFEGWENIARVNPANLPVVFEQLWNNTPTGTGTGTPTNTGTGTNTPTTTQTNTANPTGSGSANSFLLSIAGGISVYFITRFFQKKQ